MVIIGVCPECSGAGHALKSQRAADETADEKSGRSAYNVALSRPEHL